MLIKAVVPPGATLAGTRRPRIGQSTSRELLIEPRHKPPQVASGLSRQHVKRALEQIPSLDGVAARADLERPQIQNTTRLPQKMFVGCDCRSEVARPKRSSFKASHSLVRSHAHAVEPAELARRLPELRIKGAYGAGPFTRHRPFASMSCPHDAMQSNTPVPPTSGRTSARIAQTLSTDRTDIAWPAAQVRELP